MGAKLVPMSNNIYLDLLWSVGTALSLGFTVYGAYLGLASRRWIPVRALSLSRSRTVHPCAN